MIQFRPLTIGRKIAGGFGLVLALFLVIGTLTFTGVGSIVSNADQVIDGNRLDAVLAQKEVDHLNWASKVAALLTDDSVTKLSVETDDHQCGLGQWLYGEGRAEALRLVPSLAPLLDKLEKPHQRLHAAAIEIGRVFHQADRTLPTRLAAIETAHLRWAGRIRTALINQERSLEGVEADPQHCRLGQWLNSEQARRVAATVSPAFRQALEAIPAVHQRLHATAKQIDARLRLGQVDEARLIFRQETAPLLNETLTLIHRLQGEAEQALAGIAQAEAIYAEKVQPALREIQELLHAIRAEARGHLLSDRAMLTAARKTRLTVSIATGIALVIGGLLAFATVRGVLKLLRGLSKRLDDGAEQVATAACQITAASQSLAGGAARQAMALEKTASSLEEITAMTRINSENSHQADSLMQEAATVISQADESMKRLTESMEAITTASQETKNIVKTIDEIAFQTNLLALNAAVEAARAGEYGAGFAVVADEVRNLAQRAAAGAYQTSDLIDRTLQKIVDGSELVQEANEAFYVASQSSQRISELTSAIAAASQEQTTGLHQINGAVTDIDSITQQNAVSAEQSAAASEVMRNQSWQLKEIVQEMIQLVEGRSQVSDLDQPTVACHEVSAVAPCWEIKKCPEARKNDCPAYPQFGNSCWMVTGTMCGGTMQGSYHEKISRCQECEVYDANTGGAPPAAGHRTALPAAS